MGILEHVDEDTLGRDGYGRASKSTVILKYPKPSILVPGTKSEKSFLCHGTLIIKRQKRGGIRGYFVPWHKHFSAMALKCFLV